MYCEDQLHEYGKTIHTTYKYVASCMFMRKKNGAYIHLTLALVFEALSSYLLTCLSLEALLVDVLADAVTEACEDGSDES